MWICVYACMRVCRDNCEWHWDVRGLAMLEGRKRGEKILFQPSVETNKKNGVIL